MDQTRKTGAGLIVDISRSPHNALGTDDAPTTEAVRALSSSVAPRPSAARPQLEVVDTAWQERQPRPSHRWSPRATLAFSGGVALALWGIIGFVVSATR